MMKKIFFTLLLTGYILSGWSQTTGIKNELHSNSAKNFVQPVKSNILNDELENRIKMITDRIAFGDEPKLTEDFVLACVTLDPQFSRRFTEFSGDQCGRYLSAFSRINVLGNPIDLYDLARKITLTQKPDGRFGNDQLNFDDPMKLEGTHMALLWGNGRLLTGLMDYYAVNKDPKILQSAIKLGNFLLKTTYSCTQKSVVERFKTMKFMGYICFTQITDGMVKLYEATKDKKYLTAACTIYPLLPPMGNQHSHGFLNTLLGVMRLYQATKENEHLAYVEKIYQQVLNAPDFLISGGVPEYFDEDGGKPDSRDEGCSESDFIMVGLELWKATDKMKYLEVAEYCLYNELMYNQFDSGDFGSHPIVREFGFGVATNAGRCWWCCDYHGLQALLEAKKVIVTNYCGIKRVNLYAYTKYKDSDIAFTLSKSSDKGTSYTLNIDSGRKMSTEISLRIPSWTKNISLTLNGKKITCKTENGYLVLERLWKPGDQLKIGLDYQLKLSTSDKQYYTLENMPVSLKKAALQYGPYLLSADDGTNASFLAEPSEQNVIYLPAKGIGTLPSVENTTGSSNLTEGYLKMQYKHDGYYAIGQVILRPISEVTYGHPANVQLWFNFEKK